MNLFRRWMEKLFGLRSEVEDEIEKTVRLNTALAGAVARAQVVQEAEDYAAELGRTNPRLAEALRAAIEGHLAPSPTNITSCPMVTNADAPSPVPLETPLKKLTGRAKKSLETSAAAPESGE